ncbi:uncharacterized protein LOC144575137 [Carex rostrata]
MLYKIFPSLFFFILHFSPVIAITSLLLAALLTYGERETKSLESCSRDNNSQINTDFNCCQSPSYSEYDDKLENQHDEKRNPEKERFRRLASLIERRRARMSIRHEIKRNLIDPDEETWMYDASDFGDKVSLVNIPRWDPFSDQIEDSRHVPGSAPTILHRRKTPFDEFLPGTTRFSRLDPFLVTEMDLAERDATALRSNHNHTTIGHLRGVELKDDPKELNLKNGLTIRGGCDIGTVAGNVNLPEIHRYCSGKNLLNADNSQLESKEEILIPKEMVKDLVSGEENDTSSYSDTILLSEYLNLCSLGILPPRKEHTPSDSFRSVKLEENEIEPKEKKFKNAPDDTSNGALDVSALDLEIVKVEANGEHDENLEHEEQKVNNGPDDSCNGLSDTRALFQEAVKFEENGEKDKNLEFEEETSSVKEVKSILKQLREEIVKAEPNSGVVPKPVVQEGESEGAENGSVTCETGVKPDSLLERLPLSDSISSNLKILRKQNKHGESSSSSSNDFD